MEILPSFFKDINIQHILATGLRIALIILIAVIAAALLKKLVKKASDKLNLKSRILGEASPEETRRINTITRLIKDAGYFILWVPVVLIVLNQMGVKIGPILAGAGIVGVAVSFGSQSLVRDFLSGFFMILDNQVRLGDIVTINGTIGAVERINFRTIILRDISGTIHIFNHGDVNSLSNHTFGWAAYVFDIGVAYKEDVDRVIEVIKGIGKEMRLDDKFGSFIIEDMEIFGLDRLDESSVSIKGRIKTKPMNRLDVGREFLRRVKHAFDDKGIEIPFPHRTIFFGEAGQQQKTGLLKND